MKTLKIIALILFLSITGYSQNPINIRGTVKYGIDGLDSVFVRVFLSKGTVVKDLDTSRSNGIYGWNNFGLNDSGLNFITDISSNTISGTIRFTRNGYTIPSHSFVDATPGLLTHDPTVMIKTYKIETRAQRTKQGSSVPISYVLFSYANPDTSILSSESGYVEIIRDFKWSSKIAPNKYGYSFIPHLGVDSVNLLDGLTRITFWGTDTLEPEIHIKNTIPSIIYNTSNNIITSVFDNSDTVQSYTYYITYNGADWNLIDSVNGPFYAGDSLSPLAERIQTFIPTSISTEARIMIIVKDDYDFNNIDTVYSNTFSVIDNNAPTVTLTSPNGGEQWNVGSTQDITWNATDNIGVISRSIYYTLNGSDWIKLDSISGNTGSYAWTVQDPPSTQCKIRITVYDGSGNTAIDYSDATFETIDSTTPDDIDPVVSVITPIKYDMVQKNAPYDITWNATDNVSVRAIAIYLSLDEGITYAKLDSLHSNPGTYSWTTPNAEYSACKIQITAYDNKGNNATAFSTGLFSIRDLIPPQISITSPTQETIVIAGQDITVTFNATDNENKIASLTIALSTDNGNNYEMIEYTEWTGGTVSKTITTSVDDISSQCIVKVLVKDSIGNSGEAISDIFTIASSVNITNHINVPKTFHVKITDRAFVIGMEKTAPVNVSLISLNGRTIMDRSEILQAGYHTIIRENAAQGMYLLRIKRSDNKTLIKKIH